MFWNRVKDFLPSTLFGRAALIYFVPVLTILGVMSVVFIQRLYSDVTEQMTGVVADELTLIVGQIDAAPDADTALLTAWNVARPLGIEVAYAEGPLDDYRAAIDLSGTTVVNTLRDTFPDIGGIDLESVENTVRVELPTDHGTIIAAAPRNRFSARNPHQFLVLIGATALIMTLIALLYLRGQIRPIRRLAAAASAFGKGRAVPYRPTGAAEVREAGQAFLEMRDRIEHQIEQRTMMLSGVSHDLRTPLTRMRLALGMIEDRQSADEITSDIAEMERMLSTFLDFARLETDAEFETVNLIELSAESVAKFVRMGHSVSFHSESDSAILRAQPMAVSRALDNLISNAARYGTFVRVSVIESRGQLHLIVEDDGPGIPADVRQKALKPFSRLDASRNQDAGGGVGLGLAIANDIARQHGGQLILDQSQDLGGLSARITLPT